MKKLNQNKGKLFFTFLILLVSCQPNKNCDNNYSENEIIKSIEIRDSLLYKFENEDNIFFKTEPHLIDFLDSTFYVNKTKLISKYIISFNIDSSGVNYEIVKSNSEDGEKLILEVLRSDKIQFNYIFENDTIPFSLGGDRLKVLVPYELGASEKYK